MTFRLMRFFSVAAAAAFIVVGVGLFLLFRLHALDELVRFQESGNVALARALANGIWPRFADRVKGADRLGLAELRDGAMTKEIDEEIAAFVQGLPVRKVKIYHLSGLTVYSSERAQIGESGADNPGFRMAADRRLPASKLSFRDAFTAFSGELASVHLVESYIPIEGRAGESPRAFNDAPLSGRGGELEGVFEIYTEVNSAVRRIRNSMVWLAVVLATGLGLLYGILVFIVRYSTRIIVAQYRELDEREGRLLAARDQADAANRAKSEFLASVSHDLRTPLNAIIGFSEMLLEGIQGALANDKHKEYVTWILKSGKHLLTLIDDILDISTIEMGKVELDTSPMDPAALVDECVLQLRDEAEKSGVAVETRLSPALPRLIADRRRLNQILVNLLSNAIKFTPANGRILVTAGLDDEDGFVFSVRDTGVGMDAAGIKKALTPFGRITSPFLSTPEGWGLGLSLAKSFVELHGGNLGIDSVPGQGTTVTVRFPPERTVR